MREQLTATSFEACIEALSHVERRRLLLALLTRTSDEECTVALDQLDSDVADKKLRQFMHHSHIPKLEALGFIEADSQQGMVTTGPHFGEIQPLLELLDDNRSQLPDGWL